MDNPSVMRKVIIKQFNLKITYLENLEPLFTLSSFFINEELELILNELF